MLYVVKNNSFLARLPGISANSNEIYRPYNFQAFANISGNFRKFSENLQPYLWSLGLGSEFCYGLFTPPTRQFCLVHSAVWTSH